MEYYYTYYFLGCDTACLWKLLIYAWLDGSISDILEVFYKFFSSHLMFYYSFVVKTYQFLSAISSNPSFPNSNLMLLSNSSYVLWIDLIINFFRTFSKIWKDPNWTWGYPLRAKCRSLAHRLWGIDFSSHVTF